MTISRMCSILGAVTLLGAATGWAAPPAEASPDDAVNPEAAPVDVAEMARRMAQRGGGGDGKAGDFPKWEDVSKDYKKVISTAGDEKPLYTLYQRDKDQQLLAELPRNFGKQKLFIAYTVAGGIPTAGVQVGDLYAYWKRYDDRLALIQPNYAVRTSGDLESQKGRDRVFTDRVVLDVPIVTMGPGGGPVIDLDALLVSGASNFFGARGRGIRTQLAEIVKAKSFPENVEVSVKAPVANGQFSTFSYSMRLLPEKTGYTPRDADPRVGYFATAYRDIGEPGADTPWRRLINRWHLVKADPKLKVSPPKEPIVFYLEHTIPVRYRRWVRDGLLEWNKAFEKVGFANAIEVYQQDARTGAHMDKDPEDARYNFILWTNAGMGFAIGPSRVDPRTGQILDADIVMDEGFITGWSKTWEDIIPQTAVEGMAPATLEWLAKRPAWDPRVRLAPLSRRDSVIRQLQVQPCMHSACQHLMPASHAASAAQGSNLMGGAMEGLAGRISQVNGGCMNASFKSEALAIFRTFPELLSARGDDGDGDGDGQVLDGAPEEFIGPLLRDVIMHEVGHTLGLRHNFKASALYSMEELNSEDRDQLAITASVMDYTPININVEDGPEQGNYSMMSIGPYDYWAIEYGYGDDKSVKDVLARCTEPAHDYATDEDTFGPDPLARRFDLGTDPLDYAESQMRLVSQLRETILDRAVDDGESWAKARQAYERLLGLHFRAVGICTNWVGGSTVNRDHKGDPNGRDPIESIDPDQQRRALQFTIDNLFYDDAFGLTPELLAKMTVDKWWDDGGFMQIMEDPTWPVHERILGLQASAMSMILNPTTLNRLYDIEFRTPADQDALTLPELLSTIENAVWSELDDSMQANYSARQPMISSLRRNLQREHVQRLIDLTLPDANLGAAQKPVANLCTMTLRDLEARIDGLLERRNGKIDAYSRAHLSELQLRIAKALDADYIYNVDDIAPAPSLPSIFFGEPVDRR